MTLANKNKESDSSDVTVSIDTGKCTLLEKLKVASRAKSCCISFGAWLAKGNRERLFALFVAVATSSLLHTAKPEPYLAAERLIYDVRLLLAAQLQEEHRVVVVDIDERSLAAVGPWPWPRETIAALIKKLSDQFGVTLIGMDIVFPEPRNGDPSLRLALQQAPVVLAQVFDPEKNSENQSGTLADPLALAASPSPFWSPAGGFVGNHPDVLFAGVQVGHITPSIDPDGKVRRIRAIWCYQDKCSAPLAMRMYMALTGATSLRTSIAPDGSPFLKFEPEVGVTLPLTADGSLLLPYRLAPKALLHISAADVLSEKVNPDALAGTLVLVGSTALGLADRVSTPISPIASGISIHGELLTAILDNALAREAPKTSQLLLLAALLWSSIFLIGAARELNTGGLFLWTVGAGILWSAVNFLLWTEAHWALPFWPLWIFFAATFLILTPLEDRRIRKKLGNLAQHFSSYVPESIVNRLLQNDQAAHDQETEQRTLSVLFADIRNFTSLAEASSPEKVAQLIQTLLPALSSVVSQNHGTVEKFTGDGLMAIWGAPDPDQHHALHAYTAAEDMYQTMMQLQPWLKAQGFPPLDLGIGINTGEAVVGIYGNTSHRAYTAHGDAINVGERIQRLTRETGLPILVGATTAGLLPSGLCTYVGSFPVKGRQNHVSVWGRTTDFPGMQNNPANSPSQ